MYVVHVYASTASDSVASSRRNDKNVAFFCFHDGILYYVIPLAFTDDAYLVEFLYVKPRLIISLYESGGALKWIWKYVVYGLDISW